MTTRDETNKESTEHNKYETDLRKSEQNYR